ncbi:hypothetical protein XH87_03550 [Bradyrhizobium sp. CCBAU 53415]|nr:hypothetical protein [Bradyrhizobium sp. CCBAU 53415]
MLAGSALPGIGALHLVAAIGQLSALAGEVPILEIQRMTVLSSIFLNIRFSRSGVVPTFCTLTASLS